MGKVHTPSSADGWLNGMCKWLVEKSDHWLLKFLFAPLAVTAFPAIVLLIATREQIRALLPGSIGEQGGLLDQNIIFFIAFALLFPIFAKAIWAGIAHVAEPSRRLSVDDLVLLINALGEVLGEKLTRFSSEGRRAMRAPGPMPISHLLEVAKPADQIRLLTKAIYGLFASLDSSAAFRVGLIRVAEEKPAEWLAYFPFERTPRLKPEDLAVPTSTVSRAIKARKAVIVEDIRKELSKKKKDDRSFVKGPAVNEDGSQFCYPVIDSITGDVAFVITIAGSSAESLRASSLPIYEWLVERVAVRIQVEHCLSVMGENLRETQREAA